MTKWEQCAIEYMKSIESRYVTHYGYRKNQIQDNSRSRIVEWVVRMSIAHNITSESTIHALNLFDKFCSVLILPDLKNSLKVVAAVCIILAEKYEDGLDSIESAVDFLSEECNCNELVQIERFVWGTLRYDMSYTNPYHFLGYFTSCAESDPETVCMARFFIEITAYTPFFTAICSSYLACLSLYAARIVCCHKECWLEKHKSASGYSQTDLQEKLFILWEILSLDDIQNASSYRRYAKNENFKVSVTAVQNRQVLNRISQ